VNASNKEKHLRTGPCSAQPSRENSVTSREVFVKCSHLGWEDLRIHFSLTSPDQVTEFEKTLKLCHIASLQNPVSKVQIFKICTCHESFWKALFCHLSLSVMFVRHSSLFQRQNACMFTRQTQTPKWSSTPLCPCACVWCTDTLSCLIVFMHLDINLQLRGGHLEIDLKQKIGICSEEIEHKNNMWKRRLSHSKPKKKIMEHVANANLCCALPDNWRALFIVHLFHINQPFGGDWLLAKQNVHSLMTRVVPKIFKTLFKWLFETNCFNVRTATTTLFQLHWWAWNHRFWKNRLLKSQHLLQWWFLSDHADWRVDVTNPVGCLSLGSWAVEEGSMHCVSASACSISKHDFINHCECGFENTLKRRDPCAMCWSVLRFFDHVTPCTSFFANWFVCWWHGWKSCCFLSIMCYHIEEMRSKRPDPLCWEFLTIAFRSGHHGCMKDRHHSFSCGLIHWSVTWLGISLFSANGASPLFPSQGLLSQKGACRRSSCKPDQLCQSSLTLWCWSCLSSEDKRPSRTCLPTIWANFTMLALLVHSWEWSEHTHNYDLDFQCHFIRNVIPLSSVIQWFKHQKGLTTLCELQDLSQMHHRRCVNLHWFSWKGQSKMKASTTPTASYHRLVSTRDSSRSGVTLPSLGPASSRREVQCKVITVPTVF